MDSKCHDTIWSSYLTQKLQKRPFRFQAFFSGRNFALAHEQIINTQYVYIIFLSSVHNNTYEILSNFYEDLQINMVNMCISQTSPLDIYAACISGWRLINVHQNIVFSATVGSPSKWNLLLLVILCFPALKSLKHLRNLWKLSFTLKEMGPWGERKNMLRICPWTSLELHQCNDIMYSLSFHGPMQASRINKSSISSWQVP